MTNQTLSNRENDVAFIESFNNELVGCIEYGGNSYNAIITKSHTDYYIEIKGS